MRLIDADALIEFIDVGHLRHPSELCFSEIDVVNMLNHAPTAYDMENVKSELNNKLPMYASAWRKEMNKIIENCF